MLLFLEHILIYLFKTVFDLGQLLLYCALMEAIKEKDSHRATYRVLRVQDISVFIPAVKETLDIYYCTQVILKGHLPAFSSPKFSSIFHLDGSKCTDHFVFVTVI